jgi:hypothetical protein
MFTDPVNISFLLYLELMPQILKIADFDPVYKAWVLDVEGAVVREFLSTHCARCRHRTRCSRVYARYLRHCDEQGRKYALSQHSFGKAMRAVWPDIVTAPTPVKGKCARYYKGVRLLTPDEVCSRT